MDQQTIHVDRTFWTNFFGGEKNYRLLSKRFLLNKDHKKVVFGASSAELPKYGCELEILTNEYLIFDIDCKTKTDQRNQLKKYNFLSAWEKFDNVFIEETINGGYHVVVRLSRPLSVLRSGLSFVDNSLLFEFLKRSMVYPSTDYNLIKVPKSFPPAPFENDEFFELVADQLVNGEKFISGTILERSVVLAAVKGNFIVDSVS